MKGASAVPDSNISEYPDSRVLARVLAKTLVQSGRDTAGVAILDRRALSGSTFPVEIVSCQLRDGGAFQVFCKYEAGRSHPGHGHRGGVSYEADVYESLLRPSSCSAPAFFGRYHHRRSGDTWLFIEAVNANSIANTRRADSVVALPEAAGWIGRFHADFATHISKLPNITRYDAGYYRGFVNRVIEFSKGRRRQYPWLDPVCDRADEIIAQLLAAPVTVVHGEFYPGNILCEKERICPVDWESAATAPGELDLASLTEGWPPELVATCEDRYVEARWPGEGAPPAFRRTLAAARLYWSFRWLGNSPATFHGHRKSEGRLQRLLEQSTHWSSLSL